MSTADKPFFEVKKWRNGIDGQIERARSGAPGPRVDRHGQRGGQLGGKRKTVYIEPGVQPVNDEVELPIPEVFHAPPRSRPRRESTQRIIRTRAERLAGKARKAASDPGREAASAALGLLDVSPLRAVVAKRRQRRRSQP